MRNVTRLGWGGEGRQDSDNTERMETVFFHLCGGKVRSEKWYMQNWRPLVVALSDEVHLGLPDSCTSHVPVLHPCTFPTSAYGLLVGLSAVYYTVFIPVSV